MAIQVRDPLLEPCPGRDDLSEFKDAQCQPVKCTRQPNWEGLDCCQFWKSSPDVWGSDVVHVDQLNPEKFKYDQYRYQIFAKPHNTSIEQYSGGQSAPDKRYVPPTTDIRSLKQTMYIPLLPHKPGGVSDYTFPVTPLTLGQPDVTSACCVPVIPANPGFQNMTSSVRPDPNYMCQTYNKCKQPMQIGPRRANISSEVSRTETMPEYEPHPPGMTGAPTQFFATPPNQSEGRPELFPEPNRPYAVPYPPQLHAPHYIEGGSGPQACRVQDAYSLGLDVMQDGVNPQHGQGAAITSVKSVRYRDRIDRAMRANAETPADRNRRLKSMYGSFGSYLVKVPYTRRKLEGTGDHIIHQGNGFAWSRPTYDNRLCYVVERNDRC